MPSAPFRNSPLFIPTCFQVLYLLSQFQQKEAAEKRLEDSLNEQEKKLQERLQFQVQWLGRGILWDTWNWDRDCLFSLLCRLEKPWGIFSYLSQMKQISFCPAKTGGGAGKNEGDLWEEPGAAPGKWQSETGRALYRRQNLVPLGFNGFCRTNSWPFWQKMLLLQVASGQKLRHIQQRPPESPDSSFDYVPPRVSGCTVCIAPEFFAIDNVFFFSFS